MLPDPDAIAANETNSAGWLALLGGGFFAVMGLVLAVGSVVEGPQVRYVALGVGLFFGGAVACRWGRARTRAYRAALAARDEQIEEPRLDDASSLAEIAAALGGEVIEGSARFVESLTNGDSHEREDHVRFERGGIVQFVYSRSEGMDDAGPGIANTIYWRVRAPIVTDQEFYILREHAGQKLLKRLGAQDVQMGDERYDQMFAIKANDPDWIRTHLSERVREIHVRHPMMMLRCTGGRVEVLWEALGPWEPLAAELFRDASDLVTLMAQALGGIQEPQP